MPNITKIRKKKRMMRKEREVGEKKVGIGKRTKNIKIYRPKERGEKEEALKASERRTAYSALQRPTTD